MALPPTGIYRYISTPEKTLAKLRHAGLLRDDVDDAHFIQVMRAVEENFHMPPGMTGPNLMDQTAMALGSFLNEQGQILARTPLYETPGVDDTRPDKKTIKPGTIVAGCAGVTFALALPVVLYLALLSVLHLRPHPDLTLVHYAAGSALALFTSFVISLVGESLIEDVVKFVLFAGAALAIWARGEPVAGAIVLGMAVGAFMPLLYRLVRRWFKDDAKSSS